MERLTKRLEDGRARVIDLDSISNPDKVYELIDRLAAYEDTGLSPEQIDRLCDMDRRAQMADLLRLEEFQALGHIDHLRELVQAEKDGRLVVLKCDADATIWIPCGKDIILSRFDGFEINDDGEKHWLCGDEVFAKMTSVKPYS